MNANGLRIKAKRRALFQEFRQSKADVIFVQETHSTPQDTKIWNSEWGARAFYAHGRSNSKGVCILFRRGFTPVISQIISDPEGRFLILQIKVEDVCLSLANIYAPTQNEGIEQSNFLERFNSTLDNLEVTNIFLGGDFNTHIPLTYDRTSPDLNQSGDALRHSSHRATYWARINALLNQYDISDAWLHKYPNSNRFTFHRGSQHSKLDYWFVPNHLLPSISDFTIMPSPLSDHSILSVLVEITPGKRGPGYWRFNNQLLQDPVFVTKMLTHITESLEQEFDTPTAMWEWLKYKIRQFCIQYSIDNNREKRAHVKTLEDRLAILDHDHNLTGSPDIELEATSIKRELAEIKLQQANHIIFRSKARWAMAGEKPSAYFLGLEKRQRKTNVISAIRNELGNVVTNSKEILSVQKAYFEKIYTENDNCSVQ